MLRVARLASGFWCLAFLWGALAAPTLVFSAQASERAQTQNVLQASSLQKSPAKPQEDRAADARAVNVAGRQRMLSQRISKAACFVAHGIKQQRHRDQLKAAHELFRSSLHNLQQGDGGLPKPRNAEVAGGLHRVGLLWSWFGPSALAFANSVTAAERAQHLDNILTANLDVLREMNNTVQLMDTAHSAHAAKAGTQGRNGALVSTINRAGRQRMLSQKLAKELCMVAVGFEVDLSRGHTAGTLALLQSEQSRLASELPSLGLSNALTAQLMDQFAKVTTLIAPLEEIVADVLAGGQLDNARLETVAVATDQLLMTLDRSVSLYERGAGDGAG
ncbi:MAG: type IV pili methyl-accepting chemotaxis transducer N-terminal domain-containing protein [Pseudomonadota bacterium]